MLWIEDFWHRSRTISREYHPKALSTALLSTVIPRGSSPSVHIPYTPKQASHASIIVELIISFWPNFPVADTRSSTLPIGLVYRGWGGDNWFPPVFFPHLPLLPLYNFPFIILIAVLLTVSDYSELLRFCGSSSYPFSTVLAKGTNLPICLHRKVSQGGTDTLTCDSGKVVTGGCARQFPLQPLPSA